MRDSIANDKKNLSQPNVAVYDRHDYDYSSYWKSRDYEHFAETHALRKALKDATGSWFADFGGSYGRHIPLYSQKFHNVILCDYSVKALKQARENLKKNGITNVHLVAANIYHLPIKTEALDAAMMVRVIHHFENPETALSEVSRVLLPAGKFILEYANKHHLKSVFKAFLRFDFKYIFSKEPHLIQSRGHHEGSKPSDPGIIYNFTYKHMKFMLVSCEMIVKKAYAASFFRTPFVKRTVPQKLLNRLEIIAQSLLGWSKITPSIILKTLKTRAASENTAQTPHQPANDILDLLCCPKCKDSLKVKADKLLCDRCNLEFRKDGAIFDLRYPLLD